MKEDVWVVVRCKSSTTLDLEASLTEGGLSAWTPDIFKKSRLPRTRATVVSRQPLMPSFVFVKEQDITAQGGFGCLEKHFVKPSVRSDGVVLRVKDSELTALRKASGKGGKEDPGLFKPPAIGSKWKFLSGIFMDRKACVVGLKGKLVCLAFPEANCPPMLIGYGQLYKTAIEDTTSAVP